MKLLFAVLLIWLTGSFVGTRLEDFIERLGYPLPDWIGVEFGFLIGWMWILFMVLRIGTKVVEED